MVELFANRGDPDQMPHSVVSDLGLHCLPVTRLGVVSLQWVKEAVTAVVADNSLKYVFFFFYVPPLT